MNRCIRCGCYLDAGEGRECDECVKEEQIKEMKSKNYVELLNSKFEQLELQFQKG